MIKKNIFSSKNKKGGNRKLTLKQRLFCDYYLNLQGNGTKAVIKAGYNVKGNKRLAATIASENLTKPNILAHIEQGLEKFGFNEGNIQKHHLFLIKQFANLSVKAKAIDMYYKLKGNYSAKKYEIEQEATIVRIVNYGNSENKSKSSQNKNASLLSPPK